MAEPSPEFVHHAQQVQEYLEHNLSEADTRVYLIDPVLRLLGYTRVNDLRREVPVPATSQFLDYELYADGKAQAIVEAKALRFTITDQAAAQCVQYASVLGVRWCLITNGVSWAIYNAHASGPLSEKRVAHVRLDGDDAAVLEAWEVLSLFSRDSLTRSSPMSKLLAERVVADELGRPDSPAVQALRRAISKRFGERVTPQAIVDVVKKMMSRPPIHVEPAPTANGPVEELPVEPRRRGRPPKVHAEVVADGARVQDGRQRRQRTEVLKPDGTRVTLSDLIRSGVLPVDSPLEASFDGVTHVARVKPDGIELSGRVYANLSAAASAARGGGAANGWAAWLYQNKPVAGLRDVYLASLGATDLIESS